MPTKNEYIAEERLRILSIVTSPEGLARPKVALDLALMGSVSPELAREMMGRLPVESAFLAAMDREGTVGITSGALPLAGTLIGEDPKAKRLAELKESGKAYSKGKGYR